MIHIFSHRYKSPASLYMSTYVQRSFIILLITSWFHLHRTSAPYQQMKMLSWKYHYNGNSYYLKSFVNFKIKDHLTAQGWGYMRDVTLFPNQDPTISCMMLKMYEVSQCHPQHNVNLLWFASVDISLFDYFLQLHKLLAKKNLRWLFGCLQATQKGSIFIILPN